MLANCQANAERHLQQCSLPRGSGGAAAGVAALAAQARVLVRQFNWLDPPDFLLDSGEWSSGSGGSGQPSATQEQQVEQQPGEPSRGPFAWRPEDAAALQRLDYLLAADSVYDDVLTEAFMRRWAVAACAVAPTCVLTCASVPPLLTAT